MKKIGKSELRTMPYVYRIDDEPIVTNKTKILPIYNRVPMFDGMLIPLINSDIADKITPNKITLECKLTYNNSSYIYSMLNMSLGDLNITIMPAMRSDDNEFKFTFTDHEPFSYYMSVGLTPPFKMLMEINLETCSFSVYKGTYLLIDNRPCYASARNMKKEVIDGLKKGFEVVQFKNIDGELKINLEYTFND